MPVSGPWFQPWSHERVRATPSLHKEANSAPLPNHRTWDTDRHRKGFALATEALIAKAATASSNRLPAYLALLGGSVCIAWSAIFVGWTDIPGPASAFYRMLIPAVVLLPTFFFDRRRPSLDLRTLGIIAFGGLFFAFDLAFYNTAILQTSAANATLLGNNTPIFVGLLTWLVFRQRPASAFWFGLLMAIAVSVVILWADLAHHTRIGVGDLQALAASACFAVYLMVTEKIRNSTGTLAFLRMAMISSTLALLFINLAMGISLRVPHGRTIWAILGLGLISQLDGYLFLTYALAHLPATLTSISLLTQGPLTAAMAAVLLGEPLSLAQILGGLLVLAGVGLAHRQRHPEDECNV